jgi:F-type H+-transporting ATPase subunit delta
MAELATIARPYAEALFKAAKGAELSAEMAALGEVAKNEQLRQFADNPKVSTEQVYGVILDVVKTKLSPPVQNLLRAVLDNGRLAALPEIAEQFHALVNAQTGVSDAKVFSAFPIDSAKLAEVLAALEKRFGRKLNATVEVDPELIGGIRVVVGDEVLDTSVKARLQQMKVALTA